MHSHSFQGTKLKLLSQVGDSVGQVVEGLTILRYPRGLRNKGLITPKTLNSACIRTVFKIQSGNFAGRLRTISGTGRNEVKNLGVPRGGAPEDTYNILTL